LSLPAEEESLIGSSIHEPPNCAWMVDVGLHAKRKKDIAIAKVSHASRGLP
jgi:hypothetical protein